MGNPSEFLQFRGGSPKFVSLRVLDKELDVTNQTPSTWAQRAGANYDGHLMDAQIFLKEDKKLREENGYTYQTDCDAEDFIYSGDFNPNTILLMLSIQNKKDENSLSTKSRSQSFQLSSQEAGYLGNLLKARTFLVGDEVERTREKEEEQQRKKSVPIDKKTL